MTGNKINLGRKMHPNTLKALIKSVTGPKNVNWKGGKVGYDALHDWVERKLGKPHKCENCGRTDLKHRQYHWANISGKYKRKISDWIRLCVRCHKIYDLHGIMGM